MLGIENTDLPRTGNPVAVHSDLRFNLIPSYSAEAAAAAKELSSTMKSLLQANPTSTEVTLTEIPVPIPRPGTTEHLVHIHAAALTNGELLWRKNFPLPPAPTNPTTFVPLYDIAGTIVIAPPSSPFQPGSEIYSRVSYARNGAGSEYAVITTEEMALKPKRLSWAEAATVPMSSQTAWQALFVHAGLKAEEGAEKGKKVLVTAASGGVGSWVVQLAKWAGAEVVGTASSSNIDFVKALGAHDALDYRNTDVRKWAEGWQVDVVVDCIGMKSLEDAWWVVKDGGVLISIFQPTEGTRPVGLGDKTVKELFFIMDPVGSQLAKVTMMINEGRFAPNLDSVFPLEKFKEAFKKLESGKTRGKIVLNME